MLLYDLGTESCADLFACFSQHSCGKEANVFAGPFHHWCCYEPLKIWQVIAVQDDSDQQDAVDTHNDRQSDQAMHEVPASAAPELQEVQRVLGLLDLIGRDQVE